MIKPLGKVLVECGFITNMQLSEALIRQKASGGAKRMGDIFIEMGLLTQEKLEAALKKQQESSTRMGLGKRPLMASSSAPQRAIQSQSFYREGSPSQMSPQPLPHYQQPPTAPSYQYPQSPLPPQQRQPQPQQQPAPQAKESRGHLALVQLLIKKGIISMEEYFQEVQGK